MAMNSKSGRSGGGGGGRKATPRTVTKPMTPVQSVSKPMIPVRSVPKAPRSR